MTATSLRRLTAVCFTLALSACRDEATARVRVTQVDGKATEHRLTDSDADGAKPGRGYVSLESLGSGAGVQLSGKRQHTAPTSQFDQVFRLFLTRDGRLQLVRFRGTEAPKAGGKTGQHDGRRHREEWETLDEDIREIRFTSEAPR